MMTDKNTNQIDHCPGARWIKHDGVPAISFSVWAPKAKTVEVHLLAPKDRLVPLTKDDFGYYSGTVENVAPGTDYLFRLDGKEERPDPASRWQPQGVHKASRITDEKFNWTDDAWNGLPLHDYIIYELHVGTFTPEGTFDGVIAQLPKLKELGVTAIELMPVAQFPGERNWGYDGVYPFAVQESYGGPAGLKRFVNAAHALGLAVVLDVVYNHLGPEGNYMNEFAPYFTDRYKTPWGWALNFDGPDSDHVRHYFAENALYWQTEFHLDALRLDAVHAICDFSATPFLEELAVITHHQAETLKRSFHLIAESDMNMARHILPRNLGGYGMDAQWSDDFHHALHVALTGEQQGYYEDFTSLAQLGKVWREGYAFTGEYSLHRRRRQGSSPHLNPARQFVICAQNHDQVGNRMLGDRLSATLSLEQLKLAAGCVLLSPFIPMLFMGEEYGETAPFQYFVSHGDPGLVQAVREGRAKEFATFKWKGEVPDPQAEATFNRSKLNRELLKKPSHQALLEFHRELIRLRKSLPAIASAGKETMEVREDVAGQTLHVRFLHPQNEVALWFHFGNETRQITASLPAGDWRTLLDSAAPRWLGPGSEMTGSIHSTGQVKLSLAPCSVLLLEKI